MQLTKKFIILYTTSKMTTLTPEQIQDLREEFIEFKINEMTSEDMVSYIRDIMIHDVNVLNKEELEYEINSYDDFLYDILVPYVKDEEGSYEVMQEFIHDRHANDWIDG